MRTGVDSWIDAYAHMLPTKQSKQSRLRQLESWDHPLVKPHMDKDGKWAERDNKMMALKILIATHDLDVITTSMKNIEKRMTMHPPNTQVGRMLKDELKNVVHLWEAKENEIVELKKEGYKLCQK